MYENIQGAAVLLLLLAFFQPVLFEGLCTILFGAFVLIVFLLNLTFQLLRPLARISWSGAGIAASAAGRASLLLWFVVLEMVQPQAEPEQEFEPEPGPTPGRPPSDKLAWALTTLGLTRANLTPETLKQAYRQAIRAAHPDLTGNVEDAVKINRARDAIRAHFGWK